MPVKLGISYKVAPADGASNPVPRLENVEVAMTQGDCVGAYTLYTASYTIPGGLSYASKLDIISGEGEGAFTDAFNDAVDIGGSCMSFSQPPASACTTIPVVPVPTEPARKNTVGGYRLAGCFTEGDGVRALDGKAVADDAMTLELCADECAGFSYWGAEYGRECYCGNFLHPSSTEVDLTECDMTCAGNEFEFCGSANRLELYVTTASGALPTATPSSVAGFDYIRCQKEAEAGRRALTGKATAAGDMTHEACAAFCSGYRYMGVQYAAECFCGQSLDETSVPADAESECGMTCSGNTAQLCGGPARLSLFESQNAASHPANVTAPASGTEWTFEGCYTEIDGGRSLSDAATANDGMTLEVCADFCEGYALFGTQYERECFCGNVIADAAAMVDEGECSMTCGGDRMQFCGAALRLSVYGVVVA